MQCMQYVHNDDHDEIWYAFQMDLQQMLKFKVFRWINFAYTHKLTLHHPK